MDMAVNYKADEISSERNENEQDENVSYLPADHPLMERFQNALKEHLMKIKNQLEEEIAEIDHSVKEKDEQIAEVGAKLFDLQNEIEVQKEELDKYNKKILEVSVKRREFEEENVKLKKEYEEKESSVKYSKRSYNEMLQEINDLNYLQSEIFKWNEEVQSEVALAKRVASKDAKDQKVVSEEKKKMDLILFKLDEEVRKNERELSNINEQVRDHSDAVEGLKKSMADASADLEGLQREHSKLLQAWGEVVVAIQHRDKVLNKAREELHNEKQNHKSIKSNIENTRKFIVKEADAHDKLNDFKNRLMRDMSNMEKLVQQSETENQKLDQKLDHFNTILDKTEDDIEQARSEGLLTKNHLTKLIGKLEKQAREKLETEEKILDLLQDQITTDKVGEHRGKKLREAQENRRRLEIAMSKTENQLSIRLLDLEKWRGNVQRAKEFMDRLQKEHDEHDREANIINEEIDKLKNCIKNKLIALDTINKQLEQLQSNIGSKGLTLNEARVIELEKDIEDLEDKIKESQQFWMRLQSMVSNITEKRAQQLNEIFLGRKQLMVIEQKAIKIESEMDKVICEQREIIRSLTNLSNKLDLTSAKLYEKRKHHEKEEAECELAHQETVEKLRESEMSILGMEQDLNELGKDIKEVKLLVLDKHNEALSWETKFKMAVETKKLRDEELAQSSEIGIMKAEIHRMEVKYAHLKKIQERMVLDLENSVFHRDHIYDAAYTREKKTGSKMKTQSNIKYKLTEMENKLRMITSDLTQAQKQFHEAELRQDQLKEEINQKEQDIQNEKMQDCLLQTEIEQSLLTKQQNLEMIVKKQKRVKRYKILQTCTYLPKLRAEQAIDTEMQRQDEIYDNLMEIVESLQKDFPLNKYALDRISQTLKH